MASNIRVAVIGSGAAGLCALRHLIAKPHVFEAVCFEKGNQVGGTWIYTDKTGIDENGLPIHSSMYKHLKTNLPKEVMAFPDFQFNANLPSFIGHEEVLRYLESYSNFYGLSSYIKFKTYVLRVNPIKDLKDKTKWEVSYTNTTDKKEENNQTEIFDAVIVCNGHYSDPIYPSLPGIEKFKGEIIHSHNYRDEESMRDKVVMVLGAGASGQDIAIEISSTAKNVYLSHNKAPLTSILPANVEQKSGIQEVKDTSVIFKNGEICDADVLLLCTGYYFTFPFLTEKCHLSINDERVTPLYKHVIHTELPSLSFIGICKTICPFPLFNNQVQFVLGSLDGTFSLPSEEEMNKDTQNDFEKRLSEGLPPRYAHHMGPRQWNYNQQLENIANLKPIPRSVQVLYDMVHKKRVQNLPGYKKVNYKMVGPEEFETIEPV
ncbi:hypothetical protein LOTGIDRAFT_177635 [Lottia gigantea]|uniref:Flavin-containing monooxygenase n=1 Tax=Lottia gigantea TaxID=225164 RepID=V4B2K7_LOTGI|nr:hypothetical protein LOTGIDRAFT_177635 [Lottia gigantea]ESO82679.1 hypothetical protein LOTGIDRAFT_177635 [Lottia gigantea]